jgi:hypothetical protein
MPLAMFGRRGVSGWSLSAVNDQLRMITGSSCPVTTHNLAAPVAWLYVVTLQLRPVTQYIKECHLWESHDPNGWTGMVEFKAQCFYFNGSLWFTLFLMLPNVLIPINTLMWKGFLLAQLNIDTIYAHTFEQAICGQITMLMNMEQTTMLNWRISWVHIVSQCELTPTLGLW